MAKTGKISADFEQAWVDNPHTTYAQWVHEATDGRPDAGKTMVTRDKRTRMGAFHQYHGTEAEERVAEQFKSLSERSQVGGSRAVDTTKEPVDGGWLNPEMAFISGEQARRQMSAARTYLGASDFAIFEAVCVKAWGPTRLASWVEKARSPNTRRIGKTADRVRGIARRLMAHWHGEAEGPAHSKIRVLRPLNKS